VVKSLQFPISILLIVLNATTAFGQWTNYTFESTKGVQANSIRSIKTDPSGTVWFATENGLFAREQQSNNWNRYSTTDGLGSNDINGLFLIPNGGKMAVATDNGAYAKFTSGFIELVSGLPFPIISDGTAITTGNFWVASNGGGITHYQGGNYFYYSTSTGLPTNFYRCAFEDVSSETQWFGSSNHGVMSYSAAEGWNQVTQSDGLAGNTILDICEDADGNIWLAGSNGLSKLENGQWHTFTSTFGANSDNYFSLELAPDSTVWAGGDNGIDIFKNGALINHLDTNAGLNSNSVTAICHDLNGNIWIGHSESGVSGYVDGAWRDFSRLAGIGYWPSCMVEDDNGRFFFGHRAGVTLFDGINWIQYGIEHGFENAYITRIGKLLDGTIWASGYKQYSYFDGMNWTHYQKPEPVVNYYNIMTIADDGSKWFSRYTGVYQLTLGGELQFYNKDEFLDGDIPTDIIEDSEHKMWFMTENGIYRYKLGIWNSYPFESVPNSFISYGRSRLALSPDGAPTFARYERKTLSNSEFAHEWDVFELRNNEFVQKKSYDWNYSSSYYASPSYTLSTSNGDVWVSSDDSNTKGCLEFRSDGSTYLHNTSSGILNHKIIFMYEDAESRIWLISEKGISRSDAQTVGLTEAPLAQSSKDLHVFPNPSKGAFSLELQSELSEEEICIHDMAGKLQRKWKVQLVPNVINNVPFDLLGSAAGIYFITTSSGLHTPTKLILTNP